MAKSILGLFAGIIFGIGLVVSGMSNPAKVQNFLDIAGTFDASLIFVMLGAIATVFVGYKLPPKKASPILSDVFHVPTRKDIDRPLVLGAVLFGIGWGLSGFCPGPSLTAIFMGSEGIFYFLPSMIVGLVVSKFIKL